MVNLMTGLSAGDAAQLGLNPLARRLIMWHATAAVVSGLMYVTLGLSLDAKTLIPFAVADATILIVWIHLYRRPGKPREWIIAETVFAFLLMLVLSHILAPAQYAAVALSRPLIDPFLAGADAALGVHVPDLAEWVRANPVTSRVLTWCYYTLLWQFALIVPVLGLVVKDRSSLWEYLFHFHTCAIITVVALAILPAQCAFQYYGFESTLDQTRFIEHFNGFRDGSLSVIHFNDLEGLISVPSFHAAGALMVTWSVRKWRLLLIPVAAINLALIAATFLSGAHYFVDVLITIAMFAASVLLYRTWGARHVTTAAPRTETVSSVSGRSRRSKPDRPYWLWEPTNQSVSRMWKGSGDRALQPSNSPAFAHPRRPSAE